MRKLIINEVTGFRVKDDTKPIRILDARHIVFYDTIDLVQKVKYFNMPIGTYYIESGFFVAASTPRQYPMAKLPKPERSYPDPADFKFTFETNPNKCTILWDEKVIVFDTSFLDKPQPEIFFVLYHEYGHAFYKTEKFADLYATNLMKKRGYNPSQICYAHINSLSSNQQERKEFITQKILDTLSHE